MRVFRVVEMTKPDYAPAEAKPLLFYEWPAQGESASGAAPPASSTP